MEYEIIIGLEVHAELKTISKIFCGCSTKFGAIQNNNVCPVCLGFPGTLPVLNEKVLELAIRAGLALNCEIPLYSKFDRKNYYYPDLPKNFQISQYDSPIAINGYTNIEVNGEIRRIGITRVHMEEDAGKLVHLGTIIDSEHTFIDYNRTGIPLIEIVSEPNIRTPNEAKIYLEKLRSILEYIGVSNCKMEEGSLRCDANISLRPRGTILFGTKVEIKNLNSFRSVQKSLEYEILRQEQALKNREKIIQQTRSWDECKGVTSALRNKEQAQDYRYFPEPDLVPIILDQTYIESIRSSLPELPDTRKARLIKDFGLSEYDATNIIASQDMVEYFENVVENGVDAKLTANWLLGDVSKYLNIYNKSIKECPINPERLANMLKILEKNIISNKIAKFIFKEMWFTNKTAENIIQEQNILQINDESIIISIAKTVIAANTQSVIDYKAGKKQAIGFLIGQVMKKTNGRVNPEFLNKILKKLL